MSPSRPSLPNTQPDRPAPAPLAGPLFHFGSLGGSSVRDVFPADCSGRLCHDSRVAFRLGSAASAARNVDYGDHFEEFARVGISVQLGESGLDAQRNGFGDYTHEGWFGIGSRGLEKT